MPARYTLPAYRTMPRLPQGRLRRFLVFLLIIALPLYAIYNFQLYPGISELAVAAAQNKIGGLVAHAFTSSLDEEDVEYENLITIRYRTDGSVASISCRMQGLNRARNALLLAVIEGLSGEDGVEVSLPIGNLLGGEAFSGRGPRIPIRILLAQGAHAHMESDFRTEGINQTLHRVLFSVTVNLTIMTPSRPIQTKVTQTYCVAETLIVGDVPDAFTQINRLTGDITEEELDDINDYGAQL
ncbi:MAG: sporulation protein YunB [Clostridia bacterium]|nr:sporulation protein YunB [Clostridia bacterium]